MLCVSSFAQNENMDDQLDKALQSLMLLLQKTKEAAKELSDTTQKTIPEKEGVFQLYYKVVKNAAKVEKRNDLLIKTQINYHLLRKKDIPSSFILVLVKDGDVELFGKVYSKEMADEVIHIALQTKGVKRVTSFLIIKEPAKLVL